MVKALGRTVSGRMGKIRCLFKTQHCFLFFWYLSLHLALPSTLSPKSFRAYWVSIAKGSRFCKIDVVNGQLSQSPQQLESCSCSEALAWNRYAAHKGVEHTPSTPVYISPCEEAMVETFFSTRLVLYPWDKCLVRKRMLVAALRSSIFLEPSAGSSSTSYKGYNESVFNKLCSSQLFDIHGIKKMVNPYLNYPQLFCTILNKPLGFFLYMPFKKRKKTVFILQHQQCITTLYSIWYFRKYRSIDIFRTKEFDVS